MILLLDRDDLHEVGRTFACRITGGKDDLAARLDAIGLDDTGSQFVVVGHVVFDIGQDRLDTPVEFQLALGRLGERYRKDRYRRTVLTNPLLQNS